MTDLKSTDWLDKHVRVKADGRTGIVMEIAMRGTERRLMVSLDYGHAVSPGLHEHRFEELEIISNALHDPSA